MCLLISAYLFMREYKAETYHYLAQGLIGAQSDESARCAAEVVPDSVIFRL